MVPHDYQLDAAAKIHFSCKGPFRGILLGGSMGLGKILTACLAMWLARDEPGICVVVCPKAICPDWQSAINNLFSEVNSKNGVTERLSRDMVSCHREHFMVSYTPARCLCFDCSSEVILYENLQTTHHNHMLSCCAETRIRLHCR